MTGISHHMLHEQCVCVMPLRVGG